MARRRLHLAAADVPVAAARRRLRHRRLLRRPPRLRDDRRRPRVHRRGPRARHPRHRRPRHEPHVDATTRGSRRRARARTTPSATGTSGPTTRRATTTRGSSSSTPRRRTGPGTSKAGAVLLAPLLSPPARPQLRQPRGPARRCSTSCASGWTSASTAFASTPCPTSTSATARTARTSTRRTSSSSEVRETVDDEYPDRVLLAEANQWPADVVEYFGDGDECHMAFHFPVMPRMFMAAAPRGGDADPRDPRPDAAHPRRTASGACSCATTTS